jgi:head-tail adaptor
VALIPTAGELKSRLSVQRRRKVADDGLGNTVGPFATISSGIAARVLDTRGGEEIRQGRIAGISNFDVVVRASEATRSIQTSDRLLDERTGRTFNIKWIGDLSETGRYVYLACQSGGSDD